MKCSWSQNGKSLAISHSSGNVFIYERDDTSISFKTVICAGDISEWVWSLSWDVNGKMLFTGNAAGLIQCWNQNEKKDQNGEIISTEWKEVGIGFSKIKLKNSLVNSLAKSKSTQILNFLFTFDLTLTPF